MAARIATVLASHGYNINGATQAGYTSKGRGCGSVERYMQYDVRFRGSRVVYAVVWTEAVNGYSEHRRDIENELLTLHKV